MKSEYDLSKMKSRKNPYASEQELLDQFKAGEFKSIMTPARKKAVQAAAEETLKKKKGKYVSGSLQDKVS
ncbi:MAG: hypothetical protein QM709_03070 [Spongiibacteraceae bacterium]